MFKEAFRTYLSCVVCIIAIPLIGPGLRASAQTASPDLFFEVATIKPVDPSLRFTGRHFWAHVFETRASYWSMTPAQLIAYAYSVEPLQVTGPEWANADRFDIEATFPEGADKKDNLRMLQALLKERFKLAFHIEKRQAEVYALTVGKHGEKLTPSPPKQSTPETDAAVRPRDIDVGSEPAKPKIVMTTDGASKIDEGKRGTFSAKFDREHWSNHLEFSKTTMEELAGKLSSCLGSGVHKVVDETGIKGNYQVAYDCPLPMPPPRPSQGGDAAGMLASDPQDGSLLLHSLDALGLKLDKRQVPMDIYVVDHIDRPSEN